MGLFETVQSAAGTAIKATGNIALKVVYIRIVGPLTAFKPGVAPELPTEVKHENINAVKSNFKQGQVDGEVIKSEDFKLLIANADLAIGPSKSDFIEVDCIRFRIVNFKTDPAEAVFTFQMRLA